METNNAISIYLYSYLVNPPAWHILLQTIGAE